MKTFTVGSKRHINDAKRSVNYKTKPALDYHDRPSEMLNISVGKRQGEEATVSIYARNEDIDIAIIMPLSYFNAAVDFVQNSSLSK